jgi:Tfp pilus assembly protein PilN
LFVALESAQPGAVHLISVEPDSQKLTLKVVAEAPDVYEMLKYLRALKGQTGLQEVFLSEYEIGESTPDKPMRFTVTATWDRTQ